MYNSSLTVVPATTASFSSGRNKELLGVQGLAACFNYWRAFRATSVRRVYGRDCQSHAATGSSPESDRQKVVGVTPVASPAMKHPPRRRAPLTTSAGLSSSFPLFDKGWLARRRQSL